MQYFALLISKERDRTPDDPAPPDGRLGALPRQGRRGDPRR